MKKRPWKSTVRSHAGSVRALNEDAFLNAPDAGLWCVADGMGGHLKGEVASGLIIDKLSELVANSGESSTIPITIEDISRVIDDANNELLVLSKQFGEKIGSTVSVLFIEGDIAHIIWAGDSRIYHFSDEQLEQVTDDHNQAGELVKLGFISREKARRHPGTSLLTRAVGMNAKLYLEHREVDWKPNDQFILCSDGLNEVMENSSIEAQLNAPHPKDLSDWLVNAALDRWALDNVTAVVVDIL